MGKTLSFGNIPSDLEITEPYEMRLNSTGLQLVASIVNQGIDDHLEAVFTKQNGRDVTIIDSKSMQTFLRRCIESGDEDKEQFASCIVTTLGYEWV